MQVLDLIRFILQNKKDKVFIGMDEPEIAARIKQGIDERSLYYGIDGDGKLTGLILAEIVHDKKLIFVTENLAMSIENLKTFARRAKQEFPGYRLEAMRHGSHRRFDTNKLYNKLT